MKEALLYEKLPDGSVVCNLCAHRCRIKDGGAGVCMVRTNEKGTLYTHTYDRVVSMAVDPVEKKPIFHVRPGSKCFSIATVGCNFRCEFCQNWDISQWPILNKQHDLPGRNASPQKIVSTAKYYGAETIAFTYSEPTIFFELALETAKLAAQEGIYTIFVTNGFMTPEALELISPYLHAANVDLKSFNDKWYKRVCKGRLEPVLTSIRTMKQLGIFVEVTTLLIPGENDSDEEIRQIANFIANTDDSIPWHLSAFHPDYKMTNKPRTPHATIERAYDIAKEEGLKFVYVGNVWGDSRESTYCPNCGELLIERRGFSIGRINLNGTRCPRCGTEIPLLI